MRLHFIQGVRALALEGCKHPSVSLLAKYCKKWSLLVLYLLYFGNSVAEIARKSTMCQKREKIEFR